MASRAAKVEASAAPNACPSNQNSGPWHQKKCLQYQKKLWHHFVYRKNFLWETWLHSPICHSFLITLDRLHRSRIIIDCDAWQCSLPEVAFYNEFCQYTQLHVLPKPPHDIMSLLIRYPFGCSKVVDHKSAIAFLMTSSFASLWR